MMPSQKDIKILEEIFLRQGLVVSTEYNDNQEEPITLNYLNNPDGTIRWAWPAGSNKGSFLHFYAAGSLKAKMAAKLLRLLSILGLSKLFRSGQVRLFLSTIEKHLLMQNLGDDFAIFTGTVGPNRKALIWLTNNGQPTFIKIALSETSASIIKNEQETLSEIDSLKMSSIAFPKVSKYLNGVLEITDVRNTQQWRENNISTQHLKAIIDMTQQTLGQTEIANTKFWSKLQATINQLQLIQDDRLPVNLIRKLVLLSGQIDTKKKICTSLYHGDFTPWNMFVSKEKLHVYDWELSEKEQPALWDGFHFIIQSSILVHRDRTSTILSKLDAFMESFEINELVKKHQIDSALHLDLYLLQNISYYLDVYSKQPEWHMQVQWLLRTWNELLSVVLERSKQFSQRQLLCMDIFDTLQSIPYAALKFLSRNAESIPEQSDIDLCMSKENARILKKVIEAHPFTGTINKSSKSFMTNYMIVLKDSGLLSVDCIWQFKRTDIEMLEAKQVANTSIRQLNGIKVPAPAMNFSYTWLFYILNNASVPEKYRQQFRSFQPDEKSSIRDYLQKNFQIGTHDFEELYDYRLGTKTIIMKTISTNPSNIGMNKWRNKLAYYWDSFTGSLFKKGLVITFSGVDGAGKSTVIENIKSQIEKGLRRKVIVRRHRPSLLPILSAWKYGKEAAEKKSASTLPRQGKNKSSLSSLIRFAYYYFDYFFGQFYVLFRYVWRGHVVIYDRYYFDFINDSKRSNISLSPHFTTWFYRFLVKPDLNFFLYASPEDILQRKRELDADTIKALTEQYLSLFEGLSNRYEKSKYIPIYNKELDQTLSTIYELVKTRA